MKHGIYTATIEFKVDAFFEPRDNVPSQSKAELDGIFDTALRHAVNNNTANKYITIHSTYQESEV